MPDRMNPYRYLAGLFAEFRDISAVPSAVRSNVLKAEEESERFAALVRLIVLLLIGALLGALMLATGRFYVAVALIYALNLGLSFLVSSKSDDHLDLLGHKLVSKCHEPRRLAVGVTLVQLEISALDVPECLHPSPEGARADIARLFDCGVVK